MKQVGISFSKGTVSPERTSYLSDLSGWPDKYPITKRAFLTVL